MGISNREILIGEIESYLAVTYLADKYLADKYLADHYLAESTVPKKVIRGILFKKSWALRREIFTLIWQQLRITNRGKRKEWGFRFVFERDKNKGYGIVRGT